MIHKISRGPRAFVLRSSHCRSFSYRSKVRLRFHIAGPIKLELAACQSDRKEGFNSIFWNDSKKAMKNLSSSYYR